MAGDRSAALMCILNVFLQTVDSSQIHGFIHSYLQPGWHYRVTEKMTINRYFHISTVRRTIFLWARKVSRDVRYFSSEQFINVNVFLYLLNHDQNRLGWNDEMRKLLLILVEIIERGTCIVWMWQTGNFNNQLRHKIIDSSWLIISTDPRFLAVVVPVSSLSYRTISNAKAAIVVTWVTPLVCVLPAWWAHNLHSYQTRKDLPISTKHNIHFNFSSYSYACPSIRFNSTYIMLLYSKKRYA